MIKDYPQTMRTLSGTPLHIHRRPQGLYVNESLIANKNQIASDGVIHEVVEVILPTLQETIVYPENAKVR